MKETEELELRKKFEDHFDMILSKGEDGVEPFVYQDKRFKRKVASKTHVMITVAGAWMQALLSNFNHITHNLKYQRSNDKFTQDFNRMRWSLGTAINKAKLDIYDRQLVIVNTDGYTSVQPCFLTMQFVYEPDSEAFRCIVYQRSLDKKKYYDDLKFFAEICHYFMLEVGEGVKVKGISVHVGNVHKEIS